jgi:hypothetical protein
MRLALEGGARWRLRTDTITWWEDHRGWRRPVTGAERATIVERVVAGARDRHAPWA